MAKSIHILGLLVFLCVIRHSLLVTPPVKRKGSTTKKSGKVSAPKAKNALDTAIQDHCTGSKPQCNFNIKHMQLKHALLVDPNDFTKFIYPGKFGIFHLKRKHTIHFACSGKGNHFIKFRNKQYLTATCLCDDKFFLEKKSLRFEELLCEKTPDYEVLSVDKKGDNNQFNVCFKTDTSGSCLSLMQIHHNFKTQSTVFVKSIVTSVRDHQNFEKVNDDGTQLKFSPIFMQVNGPTSLDYFYYFASQQKSFKAEFPKNDYIQHDKDLILSRGHLVPKMDMVYAPAVRATFIYLNTHPQWHIINDANWRKIEEYIRLMARSLGKFLNIYTGTSREQLTLVDDRTKSLKHVFLSVIKGTEKDAKGREKKVTHKNLAVPLYTYKIVIEPSTKSGVVFITINNPYLHEDKVNKHKFCTTIEEIPAKAGLLSSKDKDPKHVYGYSYMCQVSAFLDKTGLRNLFPEEVKSATTLLTL